MIKNRAKIDVNVNIMFDIIFHRFLIDLGELVAYKINDFCITFPK